MSKLIKMLLAATLAATISFAQESKLLTFKVQTIDNKVLEVTEAKNGLKFKDFKGKVVLLEFWGTHCPPCLVSIPHYIKLKNEYKDKIAMVAIEVQMTPRERLKKFVEAKGINYNIATQGDNLDFVRYVANRAGWRGAIPYLIILDGNGNVIDIKRGYADEQYVKAVIDYSLNKNNKSNNSAKESNTTKQDNNTTKKADKNSTK
jgi:thiol-disulfide isomerase/thioredoxin